MTQNFCVVQPILIPVIICNTKIEKRVYLQSSIRRWCPAASRLEASITVETRLPKAHKERIKLHAVYCRTSISTEEEQESDTDQATTSLVRRGQGWAMKETWSQPAAITSLLCHSSRGNDELVAAAAGGRLNCCR